ncbi:hypothetical protein A3A84_01575 [Candidatus Collierbacteria bacterium RIFCSPLOWO2_01_FULL_50_23]|uniref:DUF4258 domain-containing protein n=1 Tax=Candidatus Collierbacteria bacterium RIFCSPHIGHO2_01_FULL_50_25 TaxID=1817722 RepID=A0A1F5EX91_9BACT|nr:MAG: hypothetical protein A2703_00535 [Candidatus Collierbacteria bacterium RIFCSPHIGHO2_01_FULL_50_25]OGD74904.1 MAG: hypothetical protein A3A84_01575 [Candidatus Collierbacteria bacterium RIFCSPLOWO2_01_FULL_50_23]
MIEIIWTNHLRERTRERGIDPGLVDRAIRFPDKVEKSHTTNSSKHIKIIGNRQIVAAVKRDSGNWIVTSVWQKPYYGPSLYKKPLLERLIYRFVLWLEKIIRRSFNH